MPDLGLDTVAQRLREAGEDAAMLARLTRDLPGCLRIPLTLADARERVLHGLANREQRLLDVVDATIFQSPRSPYRRLLEHAGCEPGDLRALVAHEGIEGTLRILADRGVYVTFDEFKGRRPAVRGSACFTFSAHDFDNLVTPNHFPTPTSGSGGRPTRVRRPLSSVADGASAVALVLEAHGIQNPRNLFWFGGLPVWALVHLKLGQPIDGWLYPIHPLPLIARAGLRYLALLAAMAGHHLPTPQYCDLTKPETVARWLVRQASPDRPVLVNTRTSSAVRVASAAIAMDRRLAGVTFHCRGEPLSAARRRQIEEAGAHALSSYASVELPFVAYSCPVGTAADDMHLFLDRYAVIERPRPVFEHGPTVDALLLTSISRGAGKIALNTELGDAARVEQRACGCLLGALGLTTHLSEIRSFEKLSSEGTSFARADVLAILEEVLPARFGGTAIDYQIVEEEGADGSALLILRVHPEIGAVDEAAIRATLLEELGRGGVTDTYQARLIARAESIVVRRLAPLVTRAGKVLPFHLVRHAERVGRPV